MTVSADTLGAACMFFSRNASHKIFAATFPRPSQNQRDRSMGDGFNGRKSRHYLPIDNMELISPERDASLIWTREEIKVIDAIIHVPPPSSGQGSLRFNGWSYTWRLYPARGSKRTFIIAGRRRQVYRKDQAELKPKPKE